MDMDTPYSSLRIDYHPTSLFYYLSALLALITISISCCLFLSQFSPYLSLCLLSTTLICGLILSSLSRKIYLLLTALALIAAVLVSSSSLGLINPITLLLLSDSLIFINIFMPTLFAWIWLPLIILITILSPALINPFELVTFPLKKLITTFISFGLILLGLSLVHWVKHKARLRQKTKNLTKISHDGRILAHELTNPLTASLLELDKLKRKVDSDQSRPINRIVRNLKLIKKIIKCFQQPRDKYHSETFNISVPINLSLKILRYKAEKAQVRLRYINHCRSNIKITGRSCLLYQVISNLITNSIEAYSQLDPEKESEKLKRLVLVETRLDSGMLVIDISDWGPGLKKSCQRKYQNLGINHDQPLGLGLVISRKIIQAHFSGKIKLCSKDQGVRVTIKLPTL
jgi:signal transduction histidine kinase